MTRARVTPVDSPLLAAARVGAPERGATALFFLHGIYGRGRNWTSLARHLASRRPDWECLLIDLRLHGHSLAFSPPHTVAAAADDIARLEDHTGLHATAVLGHSFGGKVALAHAAAGRDRLEQVWVIDSTPAARDPDGSAWRLLEVVRTLPPSFRSRGEAVQGIEAAGYAHAIARWMASNLEYRDGRYVWRLDFDAVEALLRDFFAQEYWGVVESPPEATVLHFVKATRSNVLTEEACERIGAAGERHGRAVVHRLKGGHWLNVDNAEGILALLERHL
jgi:esterase